MRGRDKACRDACGTRGAAAQSVFSRCHRRPRGPEQTTRRPASPTCCATLTRRDLGCGRRCRGCYLVAAGHPCLHVTPACPIRCRPWRSCCTVKLTAAIRTAVIGAVPPAADASGAFRRDRHKDRPDHPLPGRAPLLASDLPLRRLCSMRVAVLCEARDPSPSSPVAYRCAALEPGPAASCRRRARCSPCSWTG